MVKHVDLTPTPQQAMASMIGRVANLSHQKATVPTGVKDMGRLGNVRWSRDDGTPANVREVDTALEVARADLKTLRDDTLPDLRKQLADSQETLGAEIAQLDGKLNDIVVAGGGSGNFTTYSVNPPSKDGAMAGDTWWKVVDGQTLGQWQWDGTQWVSVTMTDAVLAGVDVSKLRASDGHFPAAVVDRLWADVFTAHKISTEQLAAGAVTAEKLAAGSITAEKLAAGAIVADRIEGGSFVGETFHGGSFTGGEWRTSDDLPGQVIISDWRAQGGPGIAITPVDASNLVALPALHPRDGGVELYGGENKNGSLSGLSASPDYAAMWLNAPVNGKMVGAFSNSTATNAYLSYVPDMDHEDNRSAMTVDASSAWMQVTNGNASSTITASFQGSELIMDDGSAVTSRVTVDKDQACIRYEDASKKTSAEFMANNSEMYMWRTRRLSNGNRRYDIFAFDDNGLTYKQIESKSDGTQVMARWTPLADTGWRSDIELGSGWQMPTSSLADWQPLQYRMLQGIVFVSGYLNKPAKSTVGEIMCRLPEGYRPTRRVEVPGRGTITSDGRVVCPEASTAVAVSFNFPLG